VVGGDRARASGKRASAAGRRRVASGEPIRATDAEGEPAPLLLALSLSNPTCTRTLRSRERTGSLRSWTTPPSRSHVMSRLGALRSGLWTRGSGLGALRQSPWPSQRQRLISSTAHADTVGTSASAYQTTTLCTLHSAQQSTRPTSNPSSSPSHNQ
jgi:hypothetical protein